MKTLFCSLLVAALLGTGIMLRAQSTPPATPPASQPASPPVNKFCPIETKNAIDPTVTTTYKGKTIGFCCVDCVATFQKDPEKYMKDLK